MGDRIRKARKAGYNNITQDELLFAYHRAGIKISKATLGHWETGVMVVSDRFREPVAMVTATLTGVSAEWLLDDGYDDPEPEPQVNSHYPFDLVIGGGEHTPLADVRPRSLYAVGSAGPRG